MSKGKAEAAVTSAIVAVTACLILFTGLTWYRTIRAFEKDLILAPSVQEFK